MGQNSSKTSEVKAIKFKGADKVPKGAASTRLTKTNPKPEPGETPVQYMSRVCGEYYVSPFVGNLHVHSQIHSVRFPQPYPKNGDFS